MNDLTLPATPLASRPMPKVDPKNKQTAENFEAVFLGQMTQLMLESVEQGDDFNGGAGEQMFKGVLAEKLGTQMAKQGGIGIAPVVLDQILKMQGQK